MSRHLTKKEWAPPRLPHNKREVMSSIARNYLNRLNADYLQVHRRKEDLFWSTYMGTSDDQAGFTAAEQAYLDEGGYGAVVNRLKSHAPDA